MNVTQNELKRIQKAIADGVEAPVGSYLHSFNPVEMANALLLEVERSKLANNPRIEISMTPEDAASLALFLRKV